MSCASIVCRQRSGRAELLLLSISGGSSGEKSGRRLAKLGPLVCGRLSAVDEGQRLSCRRVGGYAGLMMCIRRLLLMCQRQMLLQMLVLLLKVVVVALAVLAVRSTAAHCRRGVLQYKEALVAGSRGRCLQL